jgi:hypothetical protein
MYISLTTEMIKLPSRLRRPAHNIHLASQNTYAPAQEEAISHEDLQMLLTFDSQAVLLL